MWLLYHAPNQGLLCDLHSHPHLERECLYKKCSCATNPFESAPDEMPDHDAEHHEGKVADSKQIADLAVVVMIWRITTGCMCSFCKNHRTIPKRLWGNTEVRKDCVFKHKKGSPFNKIRKKRQHAVSPSDYYPNSYDIYCQAIACIQIKESPGVGLSGEARNA